MPTTYPRDQVAEESEPTLRDILGAVQGVDARLANVEADVSTLKTDVSELKVKVGNLESDVAELKSDVSELKTDVGWLKGEVSALSQFTREAYGHLSTEVSKVRSDVSQIRVDLDDLTSAHKALVPLVHESLEIGKSNREALRTLKEDVAYLRQSTDAHHRDFEIHLPRARSSSGPVAGPLAA